MTGAPKIRAMEIIREVEEEPRGVYCGAIGYVDARGDGVQCRDPHAGAARRRGRDGRRRRHRLGFSEPASEYAECLLKARFLTEAEEPFRLIETMRWVPRAKDSICWSGICSGCKRRAGISVFVSMETAVRKALSRAVEGLEGMQRVRLTLGARGDVQVEAEADRPARPRYRVALRVRGRAPVDSRDWRVSSQDDVARSLRSRACRAARGDGVRRGRVRERARRGDGGQPDECVRRARRGVVDAAAVVRRARRMLAARVDRERAASAWWNAFCARRLGEGTVWFGNALRGLVRGHERRGVPRNPAFAARERVSANHRGRLTLWGSHNAARLYDWVIRLSEHPEGAVGAGHGFVRGELVLSHSARRDAGADGSGAAREGVADRRRVHDRIGRRRISGLCDRLFLLRDVGQVADRFLRAARRVRGVPAAVQRMGPLDHLDQRHDADPLQARHDRERGGAFRSAGVSRASLRDARRAVLSRGGAALCLRRADPRVHREASDAGDDGGRCCSSSPGSWRQVICIL